MKLSKKEYETLIEFLDRVPIRGHQERNDMNQLVNIIVTSQQQQPQAADALKNVETLD